MSEISTSAPAKRKVSPYDPDRLIPVAKRLWQGWVRPHRNTIYLIWLVVFVIAAMSSLYPYIIKVAFDAFDRKDIDFLRWTPLMVIAVTTMRGLAMFAQVVLTARVVSAVEADLQTSLFHHLIDSDLGQLQRETPASLSQRFTTDFTYIRDALTRVSTVLVRDLITALAILGVMVWIDWLVTLCALLILPFVVPPIERIARNLKRNAQSTQELTGAMASTIVESLSSVRIAKAYGLEGYLKGKTRSAIDGVRRLKIKSATQRGRLDPILEAAGGVAVAGILMFIGWRISNGQSTIGDFTGYVTATLLAAQSLRTLGNLNALLQEALSALQRIFAILDEPPTVQEATNAGPLTVSQGAIRFENVSLRYATGEQALTGIDLELPPGKTTAFVGRSGAGKSSLLSLVPRLYDPTTGRITIDGVDTRSVSLASLRASLALVSQDTILFDDTIAANIAFGKPGATEAEIVAAAKAAAAHDFITSLQQGYDAPVGDRGGRLSGGERQRISLARAFLRNAPILLLDEPTSALDAESEDIVQRALAELMAGRTTLVIAHRISTIRAADLIVVMEDGRVIEAGRHEELVAQNGAYANFYRLQFGEAGGIPLSD